MTTIQACYNNSSLCCVHMTVDQAASCLAARKRIAAKNALLLAAGVPSLALTNAPYMADQMIRAMSITHDQIESGIAADTTQTVVPETMTP